MDELDWVRLFRAEVPPAPPEVVVRARRRLLRHALGRRAAVVASARRPRRRSLIAAVATIVVVIAAALTASTIPWTGGEPTAAARAAELLRGASAAAAAQADQPLQRGQYVYVRQQATWAVTTGSITYLQPQLYEAWLPTDANGEGRIRISYRAPIYLNTDDAQRLQARGIAVPVPGSVRTMTIPRGQTPSTTFADPSYAFVRSLPTEPDRLYRLISDYANDRGLTHAQQMLDTVGNLLSWAPASPQLRSALYQVASRIPGVEAAGQATDAAGRRGQVVAMTDDGVRHELIFDAHTSQLLGIRDIAMTDLDAGIPAGTLIADSATTIVGVDAIGEQP
jgi:type II secretory pathway pseudopilin PulG